MPASQVAKNQMAAMAVARPKAMAVRFVMVWVRWGDMSGSYRRAPRAASARSPGFA
jgi:hypothetical protein